MAILFHSDRHDADQWRAAIHQVVPDIPFRCWPEGIGDPGDITFSLIRRPPPGELARYPNLKAIFSYGAGVDHLLDDPDLPVGVPIVRLIDPTLTQGVVQFIIHQVIHFHRALHCYPSLQSQRTWRKSPYPRAESRRVGILGMGHLGGQAADLLARLGFPVAGWSRRPKALAGVESFSGDEALAAFLGRTDILVCVLPLTPATTGIINERTLAALPRGAFLINVGRGPHVVDADLIAALDRGHLAGAALDVFRTEPLPPDDPFWGHPGIQVTPHAAGRAQGDASPREAAENIRRILRGLPPRRIADREAGY